MLSVRTVRMLVNETTQCNVVLPKGSSSRSSQIWMQHGLLSEQNWSRSLSGKIILPSVHFPCKNSSTLASSIYPLSLCRPSGFWTIFWNRSWLQDWSVIVQGCSAQTSTPTGVHQKWLGPHPHECVHNGRGRGSFHFASQAGDSFRT